MDASHPIFRGPFAVEPTLHEMATPAHYRKLDPALGAAMPAWRVHRDKVGGYVGVVADGFGFEDSPDAEWIASGRNSKNARAAALARHGNFFHWGFAAAPPELTDEARLVFLNTLAYMRGFAGRRPLVHGNAQSREWLVAFVAGTELASYLVDQLPEAWLAAAGQDPAKLRPLCAAELGFLRRDGRRWQVDADCQALGLDNRSVALLRKCVELLAGDAAAAARGRRVLERYTDQRFATAAEWQGWLAAVGDRLFHSDLAGHFAVAPAELPAPHRAAR